MFFRKDKYRICLSEPSVSFYVYDFLAMVDCIDIYGPQIAYILHCWEDGDVIGSISIEVIQEKLKKEVKR